jgi:hypothetical protein
MLKKSFYIALIFVVIILAESSCVSSYKMSVIQVEMMKPSLLSDPEKIDTIAILYREQPQSDTIPYRFSRQYKLIRHTVEETDTTIHYKNLYSTCVNALANYLYSAGYFIKVVNYCDSINDPASKKENLTNPKLYGKLGIDACIFLEPFQFDDIHSKKENAWSFDFISSFPEFAKSSELEYIDANLIWLVNFKGDTVNHKYPQFDALYYGNSVYPEFFGSPGKHKLLVENSAAYFGKTFGAKLIPSWTIIERVYCHSKNREMLKAEEFCKTGEWLKAAEIYKQQTQSKNKDISTKAKYNMALVCEMEGNIDAAIDWITRSKSASKKIQIDHIINCNSYSRELESRKKELELLKKQVRN